MKWSEAKDPPLVCLTIAAVVDGGAAIITPAVFEAVHAVPGPTVGTVPS
jgi:hypothetical protein